VKFAIHFDNKAEIISLNACNFKVYLFVRVSRVKLV